MSKTTQSIIDMVDSNPGVDNSATFSELWGLLGQLKEKVAAKFALVEDPGSHDLQPYEGLPESDGAAGFMSTFAGPEIDWLVHSWVGNPGHSFTNMHLTINLGAQYDIPHLGLAFGTTPDLFFYMDYMPRKDLWVHPEYMDRYYLDANENFLALQRHENFSGFISQDVFTRVAQSATSLCVSAPVSDDNIATIEHHATEMLQRWLDWVSTTKPQDAKLWEEQAQRDLTIRRTITERDPVNSLAERLFGKPLVERLVRALWSGDRALPRAHLWNSDAG